MQLFNNLGSELRDKNKYAPESDHPQVMTLRGVLITPPTFSVLTSPTFVILYLVSNLRYITSPLRASQRVLRWFGD